MKAMILHELWSLKENETPKSVDPGNSDLFSILYN